MVRHSTEPNPVPRLQGLDSLAEAVRGFGEVTVVPADVNDPQQLLDVADKAVERYGRLDTWMRLAAV